MRKLTNLRTAILALLLLTWAQVCGAVQTERRIMNIRYEGTSALSGRDFEPILPFSIGDSWQEGTADTTRQALLDYYAKRGFYKAKVTIANERFGEGDLGFVVRIDEGPPCLLTSVWVDDPPAYKSKHVMERFKARMMDVLHFRAGDRYDEQVLTDRTRELREWLVSEGYILANTEKVRLTYNADQTAVGLVLPVEFGDKVSFGFRGNTVFTQGDLDDVIVQVRSTGLGKDYIGVIQRRLVEEYQSRAYSSVKIEARVIELPPDRHVTFLIKEGVRTELTEIQWEGLNEQNVSTAREVFESGVSRLVQRGFFVEKDIDKGALVVIDDMKSRGYLSSKMISKSVQPVKAPEGLYRVKVVIQIAEGEQTNVGKIDFSEIHYFTNQKIRSTLGVEEGQPFNPFALEEGVQKLKKLYKNEGFLDFRILTPEDDIVTFSEVNRLANIRVAVNEGQRIKVGKIRIEGLQKTKEYVVSREIEVHEGDWWANDQISRTEANLRKLSLFSEVKITPAQSLQGPGYRDFVLELKEAEPGAFEVGPGYRSDLGLRAFTRVSYNNILGQNWIGSLGAETNRRLDGDYEFLEYSADVSFVEPRFFGTRNLYTIGLSTKKQRFPPDFNAVSTTFLTGFERKLLPKVTGKLFYKLERIRQFDVYLNGAYSPIDNQSMLIGSIVPSLTFDTRDNPLASTSGWVINGELEYAQPQFSGQSVNDQNAPAYQKWTASIHKYTALTKGIIWSNVLAGGFERSDVAGRPIPLIKLFRLGGISTIRGFQEDSINVDTISVVGTLTFFNMRTQFDLPLVGDLKFAPFLDAGNLYVDTLTDNPFFRVGAGVGLHYLTPIGPINLDWGHKLNPIGGESEDQIHFSVGMI